MQDQKQIDSTAQPKPSKTMRGILMLLAIIIGVPSITVIVVVSLFVRSLHSSLCDCSTGRNELFNNTQVISDEFNAIALVPNQLNVKAKIEQQHGDCVDSLSTIYGTVTFNLSTYAGTAFDQASTALINNGYVADTDTYAGILNPCSYKDKPYSFTKTDRKISLNLTCLSDSMRNSDTWRQIPVKNLTAFLNVAWNYQ